MGFYGNITNTVKTNLQFDKRYCNRFEMEAQCPGDGVMAGRYVLVEYDLTWTDSNLTNDVFTPIYARINASGNEEFSLSYDFKVILENPWIDTIYRAATAEPKDDSSILSIYTNKYFIGILNNEDYYDEVIEEQERVRAELAQLENEKIVGHISEAEYKNRKDALYIAYNVFLEDKGGSEFKVASNSNSNYVTNFNIDTNYYGDSRGWDSTVWMKSYDTEGTPKYIAVAELNSVVPTFAISVDAPTEIPVSPHFDASNTNIFYTLHMQPQWGFQVKSANNEYSDIAQTRTHYTYDTENNVISQDSTRDNLNIYYNRAGFNPEIKNINTTTADTISWEPTGKSGKYYNDPSHQPGLPVVGNQIDMYEFSMLLPSLGNAVSEMWDQVYDVNGNGERRQRDTSWKDASLNTPMGDEDFTSDEWQSKIASGESDSWHTLAGIINKTHHLLGMIITEVEDDVNNYANNYIYFNKTTNKYYRIDKQPIMKIAIDTTDKNKKYYIKLTDQEGKEYYQIANSNVDDREYYEIDNYQYIKIELPSFANHMSTVNGVLLKMAQLLGLNNIHSTDTNTVQGCINYLNAIIDIFSDLRPTEFAIINEEGKIVSADWTTAQTITYTNGHDSTATTLDSNAEDCWIKMDLDPKERKLTVLHALAHTVQGDDAIKTDFDAVSKETFELYTPIVDNAGHIIGKNKETITLPKGLKSFTTNGIDESVTDLGAEKNKNYKYTATNIKDEFAIDVGNKWIESKIDGNTLTMAHSLYTIETTGATPTDLNGSKSGEDTGVLVLRDIDQDLAGHVTKNKQHSYTLPYSYKYLTTNGSSSSDKTDLSSTNTDDNSTILPTTTFTKAKKGSDTLAFNTANKWIQTKISEGNDGQNSIIEIAHAKQTPEHVIPTDKSTFNDKNNTFTVTNVEWDEAAHIKKATTTTYVLGNNFSTLSFQNNNETESVTFNPANAYDNLPIKLDHWIKFVSSDTELFINHNKPDNSNATTINEHEDETLKFASTFSVPSFSYDATGHVVSATTHTLTLPTLSREDGATGNILVSSAIDATDNGKLIFAKEHLGGLTLSSYYSGNEGDKAPDYSTIASTDTMKQAIGKLESGYLSNASKLATLQGTGAGSVTAAIAAVTGGDTTTIKALNEALSGKLDNKSYTITSEKDPTVTLTGTIEEILLAILERTIPDSTSGEGGDNPPAEENGETT